MFEKRCFEVTIPIAQQTTLALLLLLIRVCGGKLDKQEMREEANFEAPERGDQLLVAIDSWFNSCEIPQSLVTSVFNHGN